MPTIDETTPWTHAQASSRALKHQDRTIDVDSSEFQVVDRPVSTKGSWLSSGAFFAASLSLAVGSAALLLAEVRNTRSAPELPALRPAPRASASTDADAAPSAPDNVPVSRSPTPASRDASGTNVRVAAQDASLQAAAVPSVPAPIPRTERAHRSAPKRDHASLAPPSRSRAAGKHGRPARSDSRKVGSRANRVAKVNKF